MAIRKAVTKFRRRIRYIHPERIVAVGSDGIPASWAEFRRLLLDVPPPSFWKPYYDEDDPFSRRKPV